MLLSGEFHSFCLRNQIFSAYLNLYFVVKKQYKMLKKTIEFTNACKLTKLFQ